MKIAVCMKIVDGEPNPFDAAALECALAIGGEVVVVSMCPPSAADALRRLTRLGVRAILLSDPLFSGSDTLATARVLARAMEKLNPALILCGRQTVDGDTGQVGPCLAALLGLPVVTNVMALDEMSVKSGVVMTRLGSERFRIPCILTVERIASLRFASLFAKTGTVETWGNAELCLPKPLCGLAGSPTRVLETFENKKGRRVCRWISPEELPGLIEKLRAVPNVPALPPKADVLLPEIWCVGKEVVPQAESLARHVTVLPKENPERIAARAKEENPPVILWNADLWGRRNAPVAAALLQTGLCADCTALETDGRLLYMFRPARGGNITAKITCRTTPQMATVRTVPGRNENAENDDCISEEALERDVILSIGKGAADHRAEAETLAKKLGAALCASRGLVDCGGAPYAEQVGLTGKSVSPRVYLAAGISGAVHHTCAIENAGSIIAVNPDRSARIFEYADYGVAARFEDVCRLF